MTTHIETLEMVQAELMEKLKLLLATLQKEREGIVDFNIKAVQESTRLQGSVKVL